MAVTPHPVHKAGEGEGTEIREQHEQIDNIAHHPEDRSSKCVNHKHPDDERHPPHLEEVGLMNRLHPDVVVEIIDLVDVVPIISGDDAPGMDIERKSLLILWSDKFDLPERKPVGQHQGNDAAQQQKPRRKTEWTSEKPELAFEKLVKSCHGKQKLGSSNLLDGVLILEFDESSGLGD